MTLLQSNKVLWATLDSLEQIDAEGELDTLIDYEVMDIIHRHAFDLFDYDPSEAEVMSLYKQTRRMFFELI